MTQVAEETTTYRDKKKTRLFLFLPGVILVCLVSYLLTLGILTLSFGKPLPTSRIMPSETNVPSYTPFTITPPSDARQAIADEIHGAVEKIPFSEKTYIPVATGSSVYQGEIIKTDKNSQAVLRIPDTLTLHMSELSHVIASSLLPSTTLMTQQGGGVRYTVPRDAPPVSVRILHSLFTIASGSAILSIDSSDIHIQTNNSTVVVAIVDINNDTKVWHLEQERSLVLDDENMSMWEGKKRLYPDN